VLGRARPCYITEEMGMGMGMGMEMEMEIGMAMGTPRSLDSNCGFGFRGGGSKRFDRLPCVVPAVQAMAGNSAEIIRQVVLSPAGFLRNLSVVCSLGSCPFLKRHPGSWDGLW